MTKKLYVFVAGAAFVFTSYSNNALAYANYPSVQDTTKAPVEKLPPNNSYSPAFKGQTRIEGIKTKTTLDVKVLAEGLKRPWGITILPDGRLLITEKTGTMKIVTTSGMVSEPITGLPAVNSGGQGGLLGLTTDPAFSKNRIVYWVFSEKTSTGNLTAVAKGTLSADEKKMENVSVIYRADPAHPSMGHYGGRILVDKTGNLLVTTGERSNLETRPQAQYLTSANGKVLRITKDGKPAPGNPILGAGAKPEIYSYGHRNVQNLAFHPVTGDIWTAEFGPMGGDELNLVKPGKDYGWPAITYGLEYSGAKVGEGIQQKEGMEQPVYYWNPSISPSGMSFYSGNMISEWKNNLFIGALSGKHILRLVIKDNKVVGEERLLADQNQRFRSTMQGKDGALYAITDEGRLYRIAKK
jgi:glucose/arabinose dehydrogenase